MTDLDIRIADFIADYNSLLEGFDDELAGIEDIGSTTKIKTLRGVKMDDLECDEILFEEYHEIKEIVKNLK